MAFLGSMLPRDGGYRQVAPPTGWAVGGGPYVFIHEVAHIFGAMHQRNNSFSQLYTNLEVNYGYGYQMVGSTVVNEDGTESGGKVTVMGSSSSPYTIRIPYFSKDMQVPGK